MEIQETLDLIEIAVFCDNCAIRERDLVLTQSSHATGLIPILATNESSLPGSQKVASPRAGVAVTSADKQMGSRHH
jgi:hypothetical protein